MRNRTTVERVAKLLPDNLQLAPDADLPPRIDEPLILGSTWQFIRQPFEFITRCQEQGNIVRFRLKTSDMFLVSHPDAIHHILIQNNQNYRKGELTQLIEEITGNGLVTSEGDMWRRQRHMINPAFGPKQIANHTETMTEYTERLVTEWEDGEVVDIREEMNQLILEIVTQALFHTDIREDQRGQRVIRALETTINNSWGAVTGIFDRIPERIPLPPRHRYYTAIDELDTIVHEIIEERRQSDDNGDDVVSMLLDAQDEDGRGMTDKQLRDEVLTLLIAGYGSTAFAMTATLYLVARHPLVEAELLDELDSVLGRRTPSIDDLDDLEYTERVIKESMRLFPPSPRGISREAIQSDEVEGYRIPAGAQILISQWPVHRDPRWYDDPLAFDPDRWTQALEASRPALAYFPFSAGPRRCLGDRFAMQETQLVLATIIQRCHLELRTDDLDPFPGGSTAQSSTTQSIKATVHQRGDD